MRTRTRQFGLTAYLVVALPGLALAQFPSELVGFNGPPIDDPATAQEMFRIPQFSGTTSAYIQANTSGFNNNAAFRASGLQTEGDAALDVFFRWVSTSDPDGWVRLSTFDAPVRPNPALDTRGKVRFRLTNRSEVFRGAIGLCLAVRETGAVGVAQLGNGGNAGPIEWVGVSTASNAVTAGANGIVNTTASGDDVQVQPVGFDVIAAGLPADTAVISPGPNGTIDSAPVGDDQHRRGYKLGGPTGTERIPVPAMTLTPTAAPYTIEWNLATGHVTVNGVDRGGGFAPFTGNGVLDAPNFRGTLEHLAITKVATDTATLIDIAIDELQFEATVADPTPPPTVQAPIVDTDTQVLVNTTADATSATLYINDVPSGTVAPVSQVATFNGVSLDVGDIVTATQTANAEVSQRSAPVVVYAAGTALAENFDSYTSQAELLTIWSLDTPANTRAVHIGAGSAASCDSFVAEDFEAGTAVARLYYNLGSVNGSDAEPLWVTYHFKHDANNANTRARFELTSSLSPVDGALGFAFSNGVAGAFTTQYTTMTRGTTTIPGYSEDYFTYDYALTGIERVPGVWHTMQIEVRSGIVNFYIDDVLANPVDEGGLPLYPDGVPRLNTNSFQYVVLGVGFSNNGPAMLYDNISVTLGDTPLPFGPPNPVASPSIDGALAPSRTTVGLTGIDAAASIVRVYANGSSIGTAGPPFTGGNATVNVPALSDGQEINATQTVGGVESCFSATVTVAVPAPTLEQIITPDQTTVEVRNVEENIASLVSVYRDQGVGDLVLLGALSNPASDSVNVPVSALELGWTIVATQTIGGTEGPPSARVVVREPGILGEWIETSTLPAGLTDHQLVILNDYAYAIAGRSDASAVASTTVYYAPINSNGSLGAWQTTTALPQAKAAHGAAGFNGRVYVWGGWTTGFPTVNTCHYAVQNPDGTLGPWTLSASTIPNNDLEPAAIQMDAFGRGVMQFNGVVYVINGEWDGTTIFGNTNNCYYSVIQPSGDYGPWVQTSSTATATGSWFHGVAALEGANANYMYRIAGNYRGTNETAMLKAVINADGSLAPWEDDPALFPVGRYEHAVAVADNQYIIAACGLFADQPQNTVYVSQVDPQTGALGEWERDLDYPLTVSRNCAAAYEVGGRWYLLVVAGGPYSGSGRTGRCFYNQLDIGTPPPPCPGDVNGDGEVGLPDLATLLANFGRNPATPEQGDIDGDMDVDLTDLATLLANFGSVCP